MNNKKRIPRKKSIIGEKFGRLEVKSVTEQRTKKKSIYYDCICECGNHRLATVDSLRRSNITQCQECASLVRKKILSANSYQSITQALNVEGTNLAIISPNRKNSNNTSGYKGVTFDKSANKWRAQIVFKGKGHTLGRFMDKESAINARIQAEKELFDPIIGKYKEIGIVINDKDYSKHLK